MNSPFFSSIKQDAEMLGLVLRDSDAQEHDNCCDVMAWPNAPWWVRLQQIDKERITISGFVRAEGLSGDRTDIHNIVGALLAIHFQCCGKLCVHMTDVPHPAVPGELYARELILAPFPTKGRMLRMDQATIGWINEIFTVINASRELMSASFSFQYPNEEPQYQRPTWLAAVTEITGDTEDGFCVWWSQRMQDAMWQHFRSVQSGIGVYRLTPLITENLRAHLHGAKDAIRDTDAALKTELEESGFESELKKRREIGIRVAMAVDDYSKVNGPPIEVWTNSHLFLIGQACIVEVAWSDFGLDDEEEEFA